MFHGLFFFFYIFSRTCTAIKFTRLNTPCAVVSDNRMSRVLCRIRIICDDYSYSSEEKSLHMQALSVCDLINRSDYHENVFGTWNPGQQAHPEDKPRKRYQAS